MFIFRPKFWGQFLTPEMGSGFFEKINFGRTKKLISVGRKNQFRSHYFGHFLQPFQWQFLISKMSSRFFFWNSIAPNINLGRTSFGCGLCACWRGMAMPKQLADTLRMFALLGCIPSCARRRACSGAGVYALARAPARKRVQARMHMHTLTYKCKIC